MVLSVFASSKLRIPLTHPGELGSSALKTRWPLLSSAYISQPSCNCFRLLSTAKRQRKLRRNSQPQLSRRHAQGTLIHAQRCMPGSSSVLWRQRSSVRAIVTEFTSQGGDFMRQALQILFLARQELTRQSHFGACTTAYFYYSIFA